MTRYGLRKKRKGMAPPSYLPRIQQRTRSSSRKSFDRRLASSRQCEHGGLTKVLKASGLTMSLGSGSGSAQPAIPPTMISKKLRQKRMVDLQVERWPRRLGPPYGCNL